MRKNQKTDREYVEMYYQKDIDNGYIIDDTYVSSWGKEIKYMIKHKNKHPWGGSCYNLKSRRQWHDAGYVIDYPTPKHIRGFECWTNGFCQDTCIYYTRAEVREMTEEEKLKYKNQKREEWREQKREQKIKQEKRRKELEEYIKREERESTAKTSWQWLYYDKRKVIDGETPHYKNEYNDWLYYYPEQTEPVDDVEFAQLKELYISKYGGWTTIDLDTTSYNGRKWY